jgi:hypothetical protein
MPKAEVMHVGKNSSAGIGKGIGVEKMRVKYEKAKERPG